MENKRLLVVVAAAFWLAACLPGNTGSQPGIPAPTSLPNLQPTILVPRAAGTPLPTVPAASPQELGLKGRFLLAQGTLGIAVLDLATNTTRPLFQPPENGIVSAASLSPDRSRIVMSYSPPPGQGTPQFGYSRLFIMPADGSQAPEPALQAGDEGGLLNLFPVWSPDGKTIYYENFATEATGPKSSGFRLERVAYPDGHPEVLVDNATYSRLSPDGTKLVYVSVEPISGLNDLYVAEANGANARRVLPPDTPWIIDAPVFSPDGKSIVFSGVTRQPKSLSWFEKLLGVRIASAHSIPADLWSVPVAGGQPQQLTHIGDVGLFPSFSPDGKRIAYLSISGVFVMNPDGTGLARMSDQGAAGSLEWIP